MTGFPDAGGRADPPYTGDERSQLDAWLDFHRATLLWKCEGLGADDLKRATVEPSSLSLLGLVRHLSEVERSWCRRVLAGQDAPPLYYSDAEPDGDFDLVADADADADLARHRAEVQACRELLAGYADLDTLGARERHGHRVSVRWVYLHLIEEYARHNGHADLIRERIDGVVGD